MLGGLRGDQWALLPEVVQQSVYRAAANNVLETTSRFSTMRQLLRTLPLRHVAPVIKTAFGAFGWHLLALRAASPLLYDDNEGVLAYDTLGGTVYLLRLAHRDDNACELRIERLRDGGRPEVVQVIERAQQDGHLTARIRAAQREGGRVRFYCAVGRYRYRINESGNVFRSPVVPRGANLRMISTLTSFLEPATEKNGGNNAFMQHFPHGHGVNPYHIVAYNTVLERQVNLYVTAERSIVGGAGLILHPYNRIDGLSGARLTMEIFRPQSLMTPQKWKLFTLARPFADDYWRVQQVARIGNHLFLRCEKEGGVSEGVVLMPDSIFCIREVIMYDAGHVMLLCCHDAKQVPLRPDDEYLGDPMQRSCLPITVLAPLTACAIEPTISGLRKQFLTPACPKETTREARYHAMMRAVPCEMYPRLVVPGHFEGHTRAGDWGVTQFGRAVLCSELPAGGDEGEQNP
jgi:hypothetical protein